MRIITKHFIFLLSGLLILSSCVPNRRIVLLQEKAKAPSTMSTQAATLEEQYIQPADELYIRINSMDDYTEYYNITTAGGGMYGRYDPSLSSYTVEINGTVFLPMIGNIYVEGFTLEEAGKKIQEMYKGYLNQPAVNVRFVDKVVTVLGAVTRPGVYTFTKREIPILEALAYAGDMTIYGNRNKVMVVRERDNVIYRHRIDLTQPDVQASKYYNIQPNDVVYVEPLKRRVWGFAEAPITLIFTTISTALLILTYIQVYGL
jgi:polysaccharide export outer membrane protein